MRVLSALVAACVLTACVQNPDPREPTLEYMQQKGYGGWIEVTDRDDKVTRGELLAIDNRAIWINTVADGTQVINLYAVRRAELFTYKSDWGFGAWGALGVLSSATHGFLAIFSMPIWILSSSLAAAAESSHVRLRLPEDEVEDLAKWARFPQGMPKQRVVAPTVTDQIMATRRQAWQLTQQAQDAAREGKCELVVELSPRVRELYIDLHEVTFLRDEGIRRCLGMPSLLAPPPPPPPPLPPTAPAQPTATPDAGVGP
jgi:hypothetical protein